MGFAAAILAMVLLFAGCGQTETKTESSTAASETEDETLVHVLASFRNAFKNRFIRLLSVNKEIGRAHV